MESFKKFLNLFKFKNNFSHNKHLGKKGEKIALRYLKSLGYEIIQCGYRALKGEVDIIAKEKDTIVFVEVKTRSTKEFGFPLEAVELNKQTQIKKLALTYIAKKYKRFIPCRFDVIGIMINNEKDVEISHIRNAF